MDSETCRKVFKTLKLHVVSYGYFHLKGLSKISIYFPSRRLEGELCGLDLGNIFPRGYFINFRFSLDLLGNMVKVDQNPSNFLSNMVYIVE